MRYLHNKGVIKKIQTRVFSFTTALVLSVSSLSGALPLFFSQTAEAIGTAGDVWITAAMPSPATSGSEYVTLENKTSNPIDLNGWIINAGADRLITAAGTLAGGASATICPVGVTTAPCTAGYSTPTTSLSLNNDGDTIDLFDESSNSIDQVTYTEAEVNVGVETSFSHSTATGPVLNTDSGIDYPDIQSAITAATAGDTLSVAAGNYSGTVNVNKALTINGASGAILDGTFIVSADDVKVDGFTINDSFAAAVTFASNTTFSNNQINYLPGATTGIGANSNPGTNLNFINNSFSGDGSSADADINVIGATGLTGNVTISGNTSTSGTSLVALFNVSGASVSGNTTSGVGGSAIYIGGGNSAVTITGNTISSSATGINIANNFGDGQNSSVSATGNKIASDNTNGAKVGADAYTGNVDMTKNWWGDASGPSEQGPGSGSSVSSQINFSPWCTNPGCTAFAYTPYAYPSTNAQNKAFGHGYVEEVSSTTSGVTLKFHNPDNYPMCFSYRTDGDTSQKLSDNSGDNYNPNVHDGLYPHYCLTNDTQTHIIPANQYVEIRSTFGAERDTDFDWTRFDVAADTTKPTIAFISPADFSTPFAIGPTIQIQASDAQSGIASTVIHAYYSDNTPAKFCPVSSTDTTTCDLSSLDTGNYYIKAGATDNAGNNQTVRKDFTIDKLKPHTSIVSPTNGQSLKGTFNVNGTASDDETSIAKVDYTVTKIDGLGGSYVASIDSGTATDTNAWNFDVNGLSDGFYRLKIQAFDAAGNFKYSYNDVQVDNTRPTIVFINPSDFSIPFATGPNVAIEASDIGGSGVNSTVIHVYNSDNTPAKFCPVSSSNTTSCDLSSLADGDYYLKAGATDKAGNNQTITKYFTIDSTRPNAHISSPSNNTFQPSSFTLNGEASDDQTSVNHVNIYVTKLTTSGGFGGYVVNNQPATYDPVAKTFTYDVSGLADGEYTLKAVAFDQAGNNHFANTVSITVDTTAPATPTQLSPGDGVPVQGANLTNDWTDVADTDHYVYESYNVNGDGTCNLSTLRFTTNYANSQTNTRNVGDLVFCWRASAVDAAGNQSPWSPVWKTVVDNTAPVITIDPISTTDTTPTITGTIDDNGSTIQITVDSQAYTATNNGDGTWTVEITNPLAVGTYDVIAAATDLAGNVGSDTTTDELEINSVPNGGGSTSSTTNSNTITVINSNDQFASTGNAFVTSNTSGGNANSGNASNDNTGDTQVLADSTDDSSNPDGQVKSDSTPNLASANDPIKSGSFLGLGWWWIPIMIALIGSIGYGIRKFAGQNN